MGVIQAVTPGQSKMPALDFWSAAIIRRFGFCFGFFQSRIQSGE
jgi:hypothetical protein